MDFLPAIALFVIAAPLVGYLLGTVKRLEREIDTLVVKLNRTREGLVESGAAQWKDIS